MKVEQVQPWAGGGAGYLSQGTQEGGGSEGERSNMKTLKRKIMSQINIVFVSISNILLLRSASESDLGTDSVDERLETLLQVNNHHLVNSAAFL